MKAADTFRELGAMVEECSKTGFFVADRRPIDGKPKMHYPFQLLSPDQEVCILFRSRKKAIAALQNLPHVAEIASHGDALLAFAKESNAKLAA